MSARCNVFVLGILCLSSISAQTGANPQWDALMEAGHWNRLRELADAKLQVSPKDAQAHLWLSKIKSSFGDDFGALAEAEQAVALDPKNPGAHAQLAETSAMLADRSNAFSALVHVRRMKKALETSLALKPNNLDALLVQMMFSWKAPSVAGGDRKKAVQIADRIVADLPVWGYLAHARLLQDEGDDATVESWLLKAVQADPAFYRARISLARFYCCTAKTKRFDKAEAAALEAIRLDPSASGGYQTLAYVHAAGQRWAALDTTLSQADKAVPGDLSPYYSAASALVDIGRDFDRAERYLNHYFTRPAEGRQASHAQARVLLASLFRKQGRNADAIREANTALRLQPNFEAAKAELKLLKQS